jgi:hypothetical protein
MAARVPVGNIIQEIELDVNGEPEEPGISMQPTDSLEFTNNAPFPVEIQFICANGPVFNDILRIDTNTTSTAQQPQKNYITTDYQVINLSTNLPVGGPYSVAVLLDTGNTPAPLWVPITDGNPPSSNPDLSQVAIPEEGWIQFNLDASYDLTWSPSTAFPTPKNPISGNPVFQANPGNNGVSVSYTLNPNPAGVPGGGSVQIHS